MRTVGPDYLAGNFEKAVDLLATSSSDLRTRIRDAAIPDLIGFQREDFTSEEDWADYTFIKERFAQEEPAGSAGSIETSLAAATDDDCEEVAKRIRKLELSLRLKGNV
jgi:hypothetical protein